MIECIQQASPDSSIINIIFKYELERNSNNSYTFLDD